MALINKKLIHSVLLQKFKESPASIFLETSEQSLSGSDISGLIPGMVKRLQKYGITAEEPVACMISPSPEYVISMLAIWEAGGVLFPIDKHLPDDLLKKYIEEVQPRKLIVESDQNERMLAILASVFNARNFEFIEDKDTGLYFVAEIISEADRSESSPQPAEPDGGSYILFTSGSTGKAKAVYGQHKSLSHFIHWEVQEFDLKNSERVSWLAPPMFDVSFRDILVPLLAGGTLVIPDDKVKRDARLLLEWIVEKRISTIHMVPSLFRLLTDELQAQNMDDPLPELRRILLAGESLFESDVHRWQRIVGPEVELINLYGPSETTLAKLFHRIGTIEASTNQIVPLGKAISNTAVLVLKNGRLCGIGEQGEIFIKTPFMSKGYYNNPELTESLFIQNPLNPDTDDIIYKTGDIGYYQADRNVVFCGRVDLQLKIHGNRVEPTQIEAVMKTFGGVKHAVVMGNETSDFSIQLVSFYEASSDIDVNDLKQYIASRLPKYMIPDRMIRLEKMVLNRNGKVDRSVLMDMLKSEDNVGERPVGEYENRLAGLWSKLLQKDTLFRTSHFFECGGHSLLAIRLVAAIYREFAMDISINDVFEFPVLKDLAGRLEKSENVEKSTILPAPQLKHYPLSHAQRRLWTLESLQMASGAMTISSAIRLKGTIDIDSYIKSWQKVVERHEILRTRIVVEHEKPRQFVHDDKFSVHYEMIQNSEAESTLIRKLERLSEQRISMYDDWLFSIRIFEINKHEFIVFMQMHHIIGDAWSLDIIAADQKHIYELLINKSGDDLPELSFQYKDYAFWQNENSRIDHFEKSKSYWHKKLADDLTLLSIPADHARPQVKTYHGGTVSVELDEIQIKKFEAICSRSQSTRFVAALAIFKLLLHRLSHQEAVVVGTTIANRTQFGLDNQVGFYVQTLALLDVLDEGMSFDQFVQSVNETVHQAFEHADYPFDLLVDELGINRNPAHHPLFDAALILHEDSSENLIISGTQVEAIKLTKNSSIYDLLMTLHVGHDRMNIELNYNSDIYLLKTAQTFLEVYCHLIDVLSAPPSMAADSLLLIPMNKASYALTRSRGITYPLPEENLLTLIEQNNARYSDKIAIQDGSKKWSYEYLHKLAGGIAEKLRAKGLKTGDMVALHVDRSAFAIAGLLGIWKAGGVYLPLNTDLPDTRKMMILEDSECGFIISTTGLSFQNSAEIILKSECKLGKGVPSAVLSLQDRAYIIYTSGTTGIPKGVVIKHIGILNTVLEMVRSWEMSEKDRCLQFASLSFDASLAEILPALLSNATIVIPDADTKQSPSHFRNFVETHHISVALLTPTYLNALGLCDFSRLRLLITAGEAAIPDDVLSYQKQTRYCNAYGPSEASIHASAWFAEPGQPFGEVVPIGKTAANCEILILDKNQQLLPPGFPGEICFSGPGVAEGYLKRPELTARYFVQHPFIPNEIIYRTGDKGRINHSGDIEIFGRLDHQVKVRGYRIEPGEIEKTLEKHHDVAQAYALTKADHNQHELIAYWSEKEIPTLWPSVAEFFVYDEILYRAMYTDRGRNDQYRAIFEKHFQGATILEIGPGPELILSRMALEAGARHVYAVELLEETFKRAKARLKELKLEASITLIHGDATQVRLPEQVDYCISEIVGSIGGSEGAASIMNAVRHQLIDPRHMIPSRSRTLIAAADLEQGQLLKGFPEIAAHYVDRIFEAQGYHFDLRLCIKDFPTASICSNSDNFEDLDYQSELVLEADHEIKLIFNRDCRFTGFVVWLTLYTDDKHIIDILQTPESWLPVWLPVSIEGIEVAAGDVLSGAISRTLSENGLNPDFSLTGTLSRRGKADLPIHLESAHNKPVFQRSPFYKELFANDETPVCQSTSEAQLKSFLSQQLPAYMIPATLIHVEKFPLSANGKIDKNALPLPESTSKSVDTDLIAKTREEKILEKVWIEVLGKTQISVKDQFFKIGGDSIKAIQLVSRLQERDHSIDMRDIFLYPIFEEMALKLRPLKVSPELSNPFGQADLLPIQKWFFRTQKNCPQHFNQSVVLKLHDALSNDHLKKSLQALYERHPVLRSHLISGEPTRYHIPEMVNELTISDIDLTKSEDEMGEMNQRAEEIQNSFDLYAGPLIKVALFHLSTGRYLLIVAHHLVIDGVSWRILLANLETFNKQQLAGSAMEQPPSTLSFKDWSQVLNEFATSEAMEPSLRKWNELLHGSADVKAKENPSLPMLRKDFITLTEELDIDSTQYLLGQANQTYRTQINDLLISALILAYHDFWSDAKVLIGMESTGRELPGKDLNLSETIGWFTSYYILPISTQGLTDISNTIKSVKEQIRSIPDKGLSYGILSEQGEKEPLIPRVSPDVLFNYFGDISNTSEMETFRMLDWIAGSEIGETSEMSSRLNFSMLVDNKKLKVNLAYHQESLNQSQAADFIKKYLGHLSAIISVTKTAQEELTPSDLTVSGMEIDDLDSFLSQFELDNQE